MGEMIMDTKKIIEKYNLETHGEGGMFAEVYRSSAITETSAGKRFAATTIYYLLREGETSKFHSLRSDEIWFFHDGEGEIEIFSLDESGNLQKDVLGGAESSGECQVCITAGRIFAARACGGDILCSCMVAPGFDYEDFRLYNEKEMTDMFPGHVGTIRKIYLTEDD